MHRRCRMTMLRIEVVVIILYVEARVESVL